MKTEVNGNARFKLLQISTNNYKINNLTIYSL